MRILVNDIAASKTGALSILQDFYGYIRENDTENEWIFLLSDHYLEETDRISVRVIDDVKKGWLHRLRFDLLSGKKIVSALKPDVYFSMQNTLPKGYRGKQAVYVHQPLGFQKTRRFSFFQSREREYAIYQHLIGRMINASIRRADLTIVQTEWMRDAVIKATRVAPQKVHKVLPQLPDLSAYAGSVDCVPGEFFYPSGNILYKNHALLYEAAKLLHAEGIRDFVIHVTLTKEELTGNLASPSEEILQHFDCMGRIEREEVCRMYQKSVLLFPSYIETFGYPPAEAAVIGTIVLASDCPFCREVLNGYPNGYYFDPFRAEELAARMKDVIAGRITCIKTQKKEERGENGWANVVSLLTELV